MYYLFLLLLFLLFLLLDFTQFEIITILWDYEIYLLLGKENWELGYFWDVGLRGCGFLMMGIRLFVLWVMLILLILLIVCGFTGIFM
jgi:hypothetical protein